MLEQNINTISENTVSPTQPVVPAAVNNAQVPATSQLSLHSSFSELRDAFARSGIELPHDATTPCTIVNGGIKFGDNMQNDFGDHVIIRPLNLSVHQKLNLGINNPTEDEKKLMVNCYNGETVLFDETEYTKDEFIQLVRERGYSKTKWEDRAILHGTYVDSDRHDKIAAHISDDAIFAFWLSPSSLKAWNGFMAKAMLTHASGYLKLGKTSREYKGINWTQFSFESTPAVEPRR